jgi:hypothetical protein
MRNHVRFALAATTVAALAAGGSAFTAGNTFATGATAPLTGYGSTTVTGATVNTLHYNLNAAGDNVDTVTLILNGDTTSSSVSIGFNGTASTSCGTGVYASPATTYTCDAGGASFVRSTAGLTSTAVIVN